MDIRRPNNIPGRRSFSWGKIIFLGGKLFTLIANHWITSWGCYSDNWLKPWVGLFFGGGGVRRIDCGLHRSANVQVVHLPCFFSEVVLETEITVLSVGKVHSCTLRLGRGSPPRLPPHRPWTRAYLSSQISQAALSQNTPGDFLSRTLPSPRGPSQPEFFQFFSKPVAVAPSQVAGWPA